MAIRRYVLAIVILATATAVANCCCLSFVGLNSLNYPRQWYNVSIDPESSPNVLVRVSAMAMGDTYVHVLDSDSDLINISILYYTEPEFEGYRHRDNYTIAAYVHYDNDWTQGVGTDVYVYLPGGANYTVNIFNWADQNSSVYRENSCLQVNYTRGNLTVWYNDPAHPLPWQASALY